MTNKFNIYWQIVRASAWYIKDVDEKIQYVLDFLMGHPNVHNKGRVSNWLSMTALAYRDDSNKKLFTTALDFVKGCDFSDKTDLPNDLKDISTEDLNLVHKDLSNRRYGFQFKEVPKAYIEFMNHLTEELASRIK